MKDSNLTMIILQTPDRLDILSLISGQAASTVEKTRLLQDLKSANADLKRSQSTLEGYNRNLEGMINARTNELREKNDRLLAEVTEKEQAQAEMRSAKEIAESATQMKSQFLGILFVCM
jgi:phosphoglycerate-specific signal transduction histidine kinase